MIKLSRLAAFVLVCGVCALSLADPGGAPDTPQGHASMWAWLVLAYQHRVEIGAAILAFLVAWVPVATLLAKVVKRPEPVTGWRNALARGLFDLFVDTPALLAAIGRVGIFGGKWNVPGIPSRTPDANPIKASAPPSGVVMLLPLLFFVSTLSGCHGYKAPTYATLAFMDEGATAATKATPPACETIENAAVDAAKAKVDAIAAVAVIHDRCGATITVLEGIGKGVKTARNSVHDAPDGALPPDALSWIAALAKQYCDAVPLLAFFHVTLPIPAGVC